MEDMNRNNQSRGFTKMRMDNPPKIIRRTNKRLINSSSTYYKIKILYSNNKDTTLTKTTGLETIMIMTMNKYFRISQYGNQKDRGGRKCKPKRRMRGKIVLNKNN